MNSNEKMTEAQEQTTELQKQQTTKAKDQNQKNLKPTLGKYFLLIVSTLIIFIFVFYFVVLKVNPAEYTKYLLTLNEQSKNDTLMDLNNANTISNLPEVILQSDGNDNIATLTDCKNKIKYLGEVDDSKMKQYRDLCKVTCGGSGELLVVEGDSDYIYNSEFVKAGVYCTVKPTPCNFNTGYAIATVNSVTCRSKYPRMFGGTNASDIVACNDENHPSTGSVLWDYANNEVVDPLTVNITHEDEKLPDGSYRFRCKFNETKMQNPYIAHPIDRFHPIEDVCNNSIYRASYSVHAEVGEKDWSCNCGKFEETRVTHVNPNDDKSTCTSCFFDKKENTYKIPYLCYKDSSPYTFATTMVPCIEYSDMGNFCNTVSFEVVSGDSENKFEFTKPETQHLNANLLSTDFELV